jgi:hypothetical protein
MPAGAAAQKTLRAAAGIPLSFELAFFGSFTKGSARMKTSHAVFFIACLTIPLKSLLLAQETGGGAPAAPGGPADEAESGQAEADGQPDSGAPPPIFYLRDGSKVAGIPKIQHLEVETRYGKLIVPRDELVRVRFAQRIDPGLLARIEEQLGELGCDDFDRREAAMEALRAIGAPALESIRAATKSENSELKERARILVDELEAAAGTRSEEALPRLTGMEDEVLTSRMTIKGRVLIEELAIESRYGPLRIRVADLEGASFRHDGPTSRRISVAASQHAPNNWLDTQIDVKGQSLRIEASGQINVSDYGVSAGPSGTRQYSGNTFGNFPMLSLVGKIGKNGKPFLVGDQHRSRPKQGGRLYLAVIPFTYNPGNASGTYQVRIRLIGNP